MVHNYINRRHRDDFLPIPLRVMTDEAREDARLGEWHVEFSQKRGVRAYKGMRAN